MIELMTETRNDVSHLPTLASPKTMPFEIMKKMQTPQTMSEKTYAKILHHHGKEMRRFIFNFFFEFNLFLIQLCK
jgi:hypothetical protein